MVRTKVLAVAAMAAFAALPATAKAQQTLDFEGLGGQIPNGYGGFNWTPLFWVLNGTTLPPQSGYQSGLKSGTNVAYSAGETFPIGFSSANPFTFNSIWITPAWTTNETITVRGWNGTTLLFTNTFVGNYNSPTLFTANWANVTSVDFFGSGGTFANLGGCCQHLAFDDLTTGQNVAPEPATLMLMGSGLTGIAGMIRRRRKNTEN